MSESRDTAIKLFGKTITSLLGSKNHGSSVDKEASSSSSSSCCPSFEPHKVKKPIAEDNSSSFKSPLNLISPDLNEDPKTGSETSSSPRSSKNNGDLHSEVTTTASDSPEKTALKKPDKILPCPRCNSTDTKFCYYNNYNVNQPRHFCKNCQRYWTAGGSMRNVPVGSGRRKNKGWASSSNQYLQIESDNNNSNSGTTILNFGSSGFMVTDSGKDGKDDDVKVVVTADSASRDVKNYNNSFLAQQVTFPVTPPWPYRWNPAIPNANFYPMPFYWGCTVPLWSQNTSPCQGKRSRDQTSHESDRGSRGPDLKRVVSESPSEATRSFVKSMRQEKKSDEDKHSSTEPKVNNRNRNNFVFESSSLALQANPAAFARSLNFHESNVTVHDKIRIFNLETRFNN